MKKKSHDLSMAGIFFVVPAMMIFAPLCQAEEVDWRGPSGMRIKGIEYFRKEAQPEMATSMAAESATTLSNVIDSPPTDGFVPWIVVTATNARETEEVWSAQIEGSLTGSFPSGVDSKYDYFIGIFDTGASAHVIGYENAQQAGIYSNFITTNMTQVAGVTGSVDAWVTYPYALFMDGLDALEPNGFGQAEYVLPSTAGMMGQSNISTIVGDNPGSYPDLVTAIGSPMSVYYNTHIENDHSYTITHNGKTYTAPRITFYDQDTNDPNYRNFIPLELRPAGGVDVQYIPGLDFSNFDYTPTTPSVIVGNSSQSLFFVHAVDLTEGSKSAHDKDRFMIDTGAQVSVIGTRVAARLGLHPDDKEFEVDIEGVTGEVTKVPGFYIDSITIPAVGQWLEFTNVPVILLEISSPEGGKLDGIIGMNLFTEYNLILRGGGMFLEDDPRLEFERIVSGEPLVGDIAPETRDGRVDLLDYSVFSAAWLAGKSDFNWNADADIAPVGAPDNSVDLQDLSVLGDNWLQGAGL